MRPLFLSLPLLASLALGPARAEEPSAEPKAAEAVEETLPGMAPASKAAVAPAEEKAPAVEPSVPAKEAVPVKETAPAAPTGPAERLKYLEAEAGDAAADAMPALQAEFETFLSLHREKEGADEVQLLKARLHEKQGEHAAAVVDLLKLAAEWPDSTLLLDAKKLLNEVTERRFSKFKAIITDLSKRSELPGRGDRLAAFLSDAVEIRNDSFYEPLSAEFQEFERRFPGHAKGDELACQLAGMRQRRGDHRAAILAYRRVLALYPSSSFRVRAQAGVADILATNLRDYDKAVAAYQAVADGYAGTPEAKTAYVQMARLLDEEKRQYARAVEVDETIVKLYGGSETALKALQHEAKLQRDRLKLPQEALKTLTRIADGYKGDAAVEALKKAADIAYDLKDYPRQAGYLKRIADDYPKHSDSPEALYDAGYAFENYAKDASQAAATYKLVSQSFPGTKYAKKAEDRLKALTKTQ